jgi:hypothetical protein
MRKDAVEIFGMEKRVVTGDVCVMNVPTVVVGRCRDKACLVSTMDGIGMETGWKQDGNANGNTDGCKDKACLVSTMDGIGMETGWNRNGNANGNTDGCKDKACLVATMDGNRVETE